VSARLVAADRALDAANQGNHRGSPLRPSERFPEDRRDTPGYPPLGERGLTASLYVSRLYPECVWGSYDWKGFDSPANRSAAPGRGARDEVSISRFGDDAGGVDV